MKNLRRQLQRRTSPRKTCHRSKLLFRNRVKAWQGEILLFLLFIFRATTKLPTLRRSYRKLLIRLVSKSQLFDKEFYLDRYYDVSSQKISPIRHYVIHGDRELRSPMPFFDPDFYRLQVQFRSQHVNTLLHYAYVGRYRRFSPSPWFDADYYLARNKDVSRSGIDPLLHFWKWGGMEGRSPSPEFNSGYYLQTNPVVAQMHLNPLLHYLRIGRLEGRSTLPEEDRNSPTSTPNSRPYRNFIIDEDSWSALKPRTGDQSATVDVIVPVFKGRDETLRCLQSVLQTSCDTSFELIVINDASPDTGLTDELQLLAGLGLFSLLVNSENRGFVYTVNRGMSLHKDRDVVLLNSDTEVFGNWLDRLRLAASRHPRTGTVTPLSNNATICSYPRFLQDNPFPLELDYAELDSMTAKINAEIEIEAPTGVGFCIYIKRATLLDIGMFDEEAFGKGYGEENDFCQRAIRRKWRNIIAADIFVPHWGMTSFQGESSTRVQIALKTMDRLHPRYRKEVHKFIDLNPLYDVRRRLDRQRLMRLRQEKNILIVCHNRGGGAERHVQEDIQRLTKEGCGVYLMRPMPERPSHAVFHHFAATQLPNLPAISLKDTEAMSELLKDLGITEIHTHSLVDFVPNAPVLLLSLVKLLGIRWEVNLHDYKVICPRINLADNSGHYCGEPSETLCNKCLRDDGSDFSVLDIHNWRIMHRRVLRAADQVLVPDQDAADRLRRYFPEVNFDVSPHEDLKLELPQINGLKLDSDKNLRIVVIGAIGKIKGFNVLMACARNARQRRLPIEYILMGYSMNDRLLQGAGVTITGRYLEKDAQETLKKLSPHVVWLPSLWPETYSYTLSIALRAGLPVVAFDIGAIARRLRNLGLGKGLLPLSMAHNPKNINDSFLEHARDYLRKKVRQSGTAKKKPKRAIVRNLAEVKTRKRKKSNKRTRNNR